MPQNTTGRPARKHLRVGYSPLTGTIYAGHLGGKDGRTWLSNRTDVTADVLEAVIAKVEPGHVLTVSVNDVPTYEVEVRALSKAEAR